VLNFDNFEDCQAFLDSAGCTTNKEKMTLLLKESKPTISESKMLEGGFD
jgi:hypothetical protein